MSLHDYLSKGQGVIYKSSDLWRQVQGLAEGINTLHNLYQGTKIAYHQDLKPANILIVRGIMKIGLPASSVPTTLAITLLRDKASILEKTISGHLHA